MLHLILLSLFCRLALSEICGGQPYDLDKYFCHHNGQLCPIVAGEPYSLCNSSCYSTTIYRCRYGALHLLSRPTPDQTFQLAISNPTVPEINKLPLHANNFLLRAGPGVKTKTYCPPTFEYCNRTITNHTLFTASNGQWNLAVSAPGGQRAFLSAEKYVGYTAAHHGDVDPRVAQADGFVAYLGGALINAKAPGWWACEVLKADATENKEWVVTGIWSGCGNATGTRSRSLWDGDLGAVRVDVRSCVVVNLLVQTSAWERGKNLRAWEYV